MRACVAIPPIAELYPLKSVLDGLKAISCEAINSHQSLDADFLITWTPWIGSRRGVVADHFAAQKKPVIVMENGWLSPIHDQPYYQVALGGWNGTGAFEAKGPCRWASWNVAMMPWRRAYLDAVALIIGQRGHPVDDRTAPLEWHSGLSVPGVGEGRIIRRPRECLRPLMKDLGAATEVHTWSSNAASWAVIMGVPVVQHGPNLMVSGLASKPGEALFRGHRAPELERLAWAQWNISEIITGLPFRSVLERALA